MTNGKIKWVNNLLLKLEWAHLTVQNIYIVIEHKKNEYLDIN